MKMNTFWFLVFLRRKILLLPLGGALIATCDTFSCLAAVEITVSKETLNCFVFSKNRNLGTN